MMSSLRSAVAIAALAAVTLVGCSDSDSDSATDTTEKETTTTEKATTAAGSDCGADVDELKTDLAALTDLDVVSQGTEAITMQISEIEDDIDALKVSAKDVAGPELDAFETSIEQVKSSIDEVAGGDLSLSSAAAVVADIGASGASGKALVSELETACK